MGDAPDPGVKEESAETSAPGENSRGPSFLDAIIENIPNMIFVKDGASCDSSASTEPAKNFWG